MAFRESDDPKEHNVYKVTDQDVLVNLKQAIVANILDEERVDALMGLWFALVKGILGKNEDFDTAWNELARKHVESVHSQDQGLMRNVRVNQLVLLQEACRGITFKRDEDWDENAPAWLAEKASKWRPEKQTKYGETHESANGDAGKPGIVDYVPPGTGASG